MTAERGSQELSPKQRVTMKIDSVLGKTYRKVPRKRVWMHTGDSQVATALDVSQKSIYEPGVTFVTLRAFVGTEPPEDLLKWHLGLRLESVPEILAASGERIEELPGQLDEWGSADQAVTDAEKIAQAARRVFEQMRTPEDIVALTKRLATSDPRSPRLLGMTISGQQKLGIRIT